MEKVGGSKETYQATGKKQKIPFSHYYLKEYFKSNSRKKTKLN